MPGAAKSNLHSYGLWRMSLEEIERSQPNGFHDTQVLSINLHYIKRVATLDLEMGIAYSAAENREAYHARV